MRNRNANRNAEGMMTIEGHYSSAETAVVAVLQKRQRFVGGGTEMLQNLCHSVPITTTF